jgi:hypothetical protein
MCLDFKAKKKFKYTKENGYFVGWKVFYLSDSLGLYFAHQGRDSKVPVNKWLNEKDYRRYKTLKTLHYYNFRSHYRIGFHIYLNPQEPRYGEECRKIYFRQPVAHGYELEDKVVVAKEIFILPVRGKPKCV